MLYSFNGGNDGAVPASEVVFDQAGNLYGTTVSGGTIGVGTVYELTPSHGSWTEKILYSFGGTSGSNPSAGLIFDASGALYGTTQYDGDYGYGTAFKLTPNGNGGWTVSMRYSFMNGDDGAEPLGGLIFDGLGNLYGTTSYGGSGEGGTVFELSPSHGGWMFSLLQSFPGYQAQPTGPHASLVMDSAGNLYGTTAGTDSGPDYGTVFELTPTMDGWTQTVLHTFSGFDGGLLPYSNVIFDSNGNLYGTASGGGTGGAGLVWEITP